MRKLALLLLILVTFPAFGDPSALYLSWKGDPTSTMVIQWHTTLKKKEMQVSYQRDGEKEWKKETGTAIRLRKSSVLVHTVELTGLEPDTVYYFHFGQRNKPYKFRTCPRILDRPLQFAVAGDAYFYLYPLRKINKQMARKDLDFVVVGGDIAYTNGHKSLFKGKDWESRRWQTFFQEWKKEMVAPDGRLIPMVVIVGNHDVKGHSPQNMFYSLFALPNASSYRSFDFGNYLALFCLDTGHLESIEGRQKAWLDGSLASSTSLYKLAAYHVAAYPSVYRYDSRVAALIRQEWVPLFERHHVKLAFEHHNHAYKRTHPIKEGKIDPEGIVYLGDGSWGVSPRKPKTPADYWYLARSAQINCFWMVKIDKSGCSVKSIDREGKTIEELPLMQ
ncbi:MAG: fibronectin type III domain-containing protein [Chlamydiales bacterium]